MDKEKHITQIVKMLISFRICIDGIKISKSDDGLSYAGNHGNYELLKGITSNGLNSDIVFLVKKVMDKTKILDFLYGGFSSDNIEYFERLIEQHEIECDDIEKRETPLF